MLKKLFSPAKGVSNIELFYDLIFVYCISVVTGILHHPEGGFFNVETYILYAVDMLTVLQIWFFTTFLQNRYGDGGACDNICLFINMFLLFFMANCIGEDWQTNMFIWNLMWALVLIDLIVHWGIKRFRYTNLDEIDKRIMNRTMVVLGIQAVIVLIAAFLPWKTGQWASLIAFAFGWLAFAQGRRLATKPARFDHLAERCALLIIVTFGETIVGIAGYMAGDANLAFAVLVFVLVVGLFLVYFFEYDHMLDHHRKDTGIGFMLLTAWLVFVVGNITVALEYLPEEDILLFPKIVYLAGGICLYLVSSFSMFRYNKPNFRIASTLVVSRLVACAIIAAVALLTNFNPLVTLAVDTGIVWVALISEYALYLQRRDEDEQPPEAEETP